MPQEDISNISVAKILGGFGAIGGALMVMVLMFWIGHVEDSLAEGEDDHNSHTQRLTTLEAHYGHILDGIGRIEQSTDSTEKAVDKIKEGQAELRSKVQHLPGVRD